MWFEYRIKKKTNWGVQHLTYERCFGTKQAEGESQVLVAGDPERIHMEKCDKQGGIHYHPNQIKFAVNIRIKNMYVL